MEFSNLSPLDELDLQAKYGLSHPIPLCWIDLAAYQDAVDTNTMHQSILGVDLLGTQYRYDLLPTHDLDAKALNELSLRSETQTPFGHANACDLVATQKPKRQKLGLQWWRKLQRHLLEILEWLNK